MRVDATLAIAQAFPDLEDLLWNIGVYAKNADHDIKLMGLRVRVLKARKADNWYGWAHPFEESVLYGNRLIHPAGRIDLGLGSKTSKEEVIRVFSHELRHIGQFHRGRQIFGYLTTEHMNPPHIEEDCYEFEDCIVGKFGMARKGYTKTQAKDTGRSCCKRR